MTPPRSSGRKPAVVALVLVIFFVISLITNILGPLVPEIIRAFHLSLTAAALLPFSFFIAFGLGSIPAGLFIERSTEKRVLIACFGLSCAGAVAFALMPRYPVAIGSLFTIGLGMTGLQVAINPLLRVAGGEAHFAFFSVLSQLVFGAASFLSPGLYSRIVTAPGGDRGALAWLRSTAPPDLPWLSLYWLFAGASVAMMIALALTTLPRVERTADERTGTLAMHRTLLRNRVVPLYFVSIFLYVGTEQGLTNWMSQFLASAHGLDPRTAGAEAVSRFWGLMTLGSLVGLGQMKLFDSRKVLIAHAAAASVLLVAGLFGPTRMATLALPGVGFFAAVMWPVILSLALNSVSEHQGTFSGILCTGIVGGAAVPLVIGRVGDRVGLRAGLALLILPLAWILAVGLWARPLIANQTLRRAAAD